MEQPITPQPTISPQRRLTRSTRDKVLGGVCAGVAEYFGIDPIIVRLGFVLVTLAGGSGVLVYLIAWILLPEDAEAPRTSEPAGTHGGAAVLAPPAGAVIAGMVLVLIGGAMLVDRFLPPLRTFMWPTAVIALGLVLLFSRRTR